MYNSPCHTVRNGALFVYSADVNNLSYWAKFPVLLSNRSADCVTTSASNTGNFVMEKYKSKKWLIEHYYDLNLSQKEMASLCSCTPSTICYWMKRHNLDVRPPSRVWGDLPENEIVERLLHTDATTRSIADEYGCSDSTIKTIFRKCTNKRQRQIARGRKQGAKVKGRPDLWKFSNWKGRKHTKEAREKQSRAKLGTKVPLAQRVAQSARLQGIDVESWREFATTAAERLKGSPEYRVWREAVYSRDNWTCQNCKVRGGRLHAHHIKPKRTHPELIFNIDNGITLCVRCHKETDSYGVNSGRNN